MKNTFLPTKNSLNDKTWFLINAENKTKLYYSHSGRPGGMTTKTFSQLQNFIPERVIEYAVKGMLPKGPLGRNLFRKLKVYPKNEHPHIAQQPILIL
jgi:large subunit ribosomal protein L13